MLKNLANDGLSDNENDNEQEEFVDELLDHKKKVEKIDAQISKLGGILTCGWETSDHKEFMRLRLKHNEKIHTVAFVNDVLRTVSMIDEDQVRQHIDAFEKVNDLAN